MSEPIHDGACPEWCNHCEVCGVAIPYGSRCPSHPTHPAPARDLVGKLHGVDWSRGQNQNSGDYGK